MQLRPPGVSNTESQETPPTIDLLNDSDVNGLQSFKMQTRL